jgi:peptidoglycan/LPS O-acetylase OafA/YrhL
MQLPDMPEVVDTSRTPHPAHSVPRPVHRIEALDGLRGVAALLVLFHHTLLMLPDFANYEWQVPGATSHGVIEWLLLRTPLRLLWAGQERALLFFVLSGFVLGLPWLNGRAAPYGRFILGRFCRIYPPYLVVMAAAAAGSILLGGHQLDDATVYFNQLGWAFPATWAAAPSIAAILNNPANDYMNEAVWTLVWEVRVALIFPLLMLPIIRWRNVGVGLVLVALVLLKHVSLWFVGPAISRVLDAPQDTFYYAEYFVFGAAVALNRARISAWFSGRSEVFGLGCLALGCLICWLPWPAQHDRIVGVGAAVILVAILGSAQTRSWLTKPPLLWLGGQSYSLYLTHLPLIMVVVIALGGNVPVLACAAIVPAAIALGWAFHRWVETPSVMFAQRVTGYTGRATPRRADGLPVSTVQLGAGSIRPGALIARSVARD